MTGMDDGKCTCWDTTKGCAFGNGTLETIWKMYHQGLNICLIVSDKQLLYTESVLKENSTVCSSV